MEARTFEQRVAQSEMASVVANIVVSSPEMVVLLVAFTDCVDQGDCGGNEVAVT